MIKDGRCCLLYSYCLHSILRLLSFSVEWYAMCAVVLGSIACVIAAAVAAYKCYNRKLSVRGSHQQLSTAIKQTGKKGGQTNI